jgi:putative ABC transport system permease protein
MSNDTEKRKKHRAEKGKHFKAGAFLPVAVRIAIRNLLVHRSRTFIIGTLVALGIILLIVGNSMLDTAQAGIRKTYIGNFTGDLMLRAKADGDFSLFTMDINMAMKNNGLPLIPGYDALYSKIQSIPEIHSAAPQLTGRGMIIRDEKFLSMMILFGIECETYLKVFPDNIEIITGTFLKQGEEGILRRILDTRSNPAGSF